MVLQCLTIKRIYFSYIPSAIQFIWIIIQVEDNIYFRQFCPHCSFCLCEIDSQSRQSENQFCQLLWCKIKSVCSDGWRLQIQFLLPRDCVRHKGTVVCVFSNYFGVFALFVMTGLAIILSYTPGLAVALKLYPLMWVYFMNGKCH